MFWTLLFIVFLFAAFFFLSFLLSFSCWCHFVFLIAAFFIKKQTSKKREDDLLRLHKFYSVFGVFSFIKRPKKYNTFLYVFLQSIFALAGKERKKQVRPRTGNFPIASLAAAIMEHVVRIRSAKPPLICKKSFGHNGM